MGHFNKAGGLLAVVAVLATSYAPSCSAIKTADTAFAEPSAPDRANSIRFIEIPSTMTQDEARNPTPSGRSQLHERVRQEIEGMIETANVTPDDAQKIDAVIVYTKNSIPILPDSQTARQEGLLSSKKNDLSFDFSCPDRPWSHEDLTTLKSWLSDFYPVVKAVYGPPAFAITVNICEDPSIGFDGLYYASTNEIIVQSLTVEVVVHEMIHAFHDDDVAYLDSYEEGMTRAAEIEAFDRLEAYSHWDENHQYSIDVYYEHDNQPDVAGRNGDFFWGWVNVLLRYQQAGYAWAKPLLESDLFFTDFNQSYYQQVLVDPSTAWTESKLKDIARAVSPTVEGQDFDLWYSRQNILNTNPPTGYRLMLKGDTSTLYYFYRSDSGSETNQVGATLSWAVYDDEYNLLDSGTGVTGDYGWISVQPAVPPGYVGRIVTVASANTPDGPLTASFLGDYGGYSGIFGVTRARANGQIEVIPLDDPTPPVSASLSRGAFSAPSLEHVRGRFLVRYLDSCGMQRERVVTKDAASYFVVLEDGCSSPAVGGMAEYPQLKPDAAKSTPGLSAPDALALAGPVTGAALLLTACGWYARKRRRAG